MLRFLLLLIALIALGAFAPWPASARDNVRTEPSVDATVAPVNGSATARDADENEVAPDAKDAAADNEDSTSAKEADNEAAEEDSSDKEKTPSDEEKPAEKKPAREKKPELHTVESKDLTIEVEAEGVFAATESEEVALRPDVWTAFKVKQAAAHGARVRKGDVLVEFDDTDIEKAIAERSLQLQSGEVKLMEAEEEFPRTERSIELDYEIAQRNYDEIRDEHKRFQDVMRKLSEKLADYYLKTAKQDLENSREELTQLQKMYEADELTEETEEIVLKRQKFQVELAEFSLEYSQINRDYTIDVAIPQREQSLQTAVEKARIAWERAKMARTLGLSGERYDLDALREARARSVDSHAKLVADRALMKLRAPCDGVAYYGRCVDGRWNEVGSMEAKLVPFGSVPPNSVVMTIVQPRPLVVETSIGEKEFPTVKEGQTATIAPAADSEIKLKAKVEQIADVPGSGNKFSVQIELADENDAPDWLMPGMTCKASIVTYEAEDAIVIPADLLQTYADDKDKKYVMVLEKDADKPVRRDLKLGKTKEKDVEVLRGLTKGDRIVKGAKDETHDEASE